MRAGLLLRIALYAIGIHALQSGLGTGVYHLHLAFAGAVDPGTDFLRSQASTIFGHCVTPLLFALVCFGFAGTIERFLLGAAAAERIELPDASAGSALRIGVKLLGLYLFATNLGPLVATGFEFVAVQAGNNAFRAEQTTSDFIFNLVGIGFGYFFCAQTTRVLKLMAAAEV